MPAPSFLLAIALSAFAGPGPFKPCEELVNQARVEKAARCYAHKAGQQDSPQPAIESLRASLQAKPKHAPLWLSLGRLLRRANDPQAAETLGQAAELFLSAQAWDQAVLARINRLHVLHRRQARAEVNQELKQLHHLSVHAAKDSAKTLALAAIIEYQLRNGLALHERGSTLAEIPHEALRAYPAQNIPLIYLARIALARERFDFAHADQDVVQLKAAAKRSKDPAQILQAREQGAYLAYYKANAFPTEANIADARDAAKIECSPHTSNQGRNQGLFCRIWAELSQNPDPDEAVLLNQVMQDCARVARRSKDRIAEAECHGLRSHALRNSDPVGSMQAATTALALVPELNADINARLSGWERMMRAFWKQRPAPEARAVSRAALLEFEFLRDANADQRLRLGSLASWASSYQWLANQILTHPTQTRDTLEAAFFIQERSRARGLWEKMGAQSQGPRPRSKTNALRRQVQEEVLKWGELAQGLSPDQAIPADRIKNLNALTAKLQTQAYPNWSFASLAKVQSLLQPSQAMISYQVGLARAHDGEEIGGTWATIITRDKVLPLQLAPDRVALTRASQTFVRAVRSQAFNTGPILRKLHAWLIEPLKDKLPATVQSLIIIPDGPLYSLPFFALDSSYQYSYAPSASIWSMLKQRAPVSQAPKSVVLVDPLRSQAHEDPDSKWNREARYQKIAKSIAQPLPESRREAQSIRRHLSSASITLQGDAADKSEFRRALATQPALLHISAHSVVDPRVDDPPAIALANRGQKDFGLLETQEIRAFDLRQCVVILGGCDTGWGTALAGEGVLSIARAFQEAGAKAVLASLWPLRDDHAAFFFDRFYEAVGKGLTLDQALAQTQRELQAQNYPLQSYAPFIILGNGSESLVPKPKPKTKTQTQTQWLWPAITATAAIALVFWLRRKRKQN